MTAEAVTVGIFQNAELQISINEIYCLRLPCRMARTGSVALSEVGTAGPGFKRSWGRSLYYYFSEELLYFSFTFQNP